VAGDEDGIPTLAGVIPDRVDDDEAAEHSTRLPVRAADQEKRPATQRRPGSAVDRSHASRGVRAQRVVRAPATTSWRAVVIPGAPAVNPR
jgi:hypothetical protein